MIRNSRDVRQFNRDEQQTFLEILHHDSRGGAIICSQFHNGTVASIESTKDITNIQCDALENDVYVSVNSFKTSGTAFVSRKASNVYSLNAMYIDLDLPGHKRDENSETVIQRNMDAIHKAVSEKRLPRYTMITSTGNGIGVFFVLTHSIANTARASKQQKFFDTLYDLLAGRMKEVLSECGNDALIVDTSVVGDHARICRLPGTRNSKSGTMCTLLEVNRLGCCELYEYSRILSRKRDRNSSNRENRNTGEKRFVSSFYHAQLLTKLENLVKERSSWRGHREVFCFVYYNTAKQCMEYQDAVKELRQFNADMGERITEARIKSIIKAVDSNVAGDGSYAGYYKLTNAWICNKLGLDSFEIKKYGLDSGCSWKDRNLQLHMEVVRKRLDAERKVVELLTADERPTYDEVSVYTGISVATVKRIAKKYRVRLCDGNESKAELTDWDALYQQLEDGYKSKHFNACKNRIKICTSVVIDTSQEEMKPTENTQAESVSMVSNCMESVLASPAAVPSCSEDDGWVSTDLTFEELTDGTNPFDFDSMEPSVSLRVQGLPVVNNTTESEQPALNAGEIITQNASYGDSFLDFLIKRAGSVTAKMYQGFSDAFYEKIHSYTANHEFSQSNMLYVLLDMIADKYCHSVSIDLCIRDLDSLYRFIALDSHNLRDYELRVSKKAVSGYVAPNKVFSYEPELDRVPMPKPASVTAGLRTLEIERSDRHLVSVTHLIDTDAYDHIMTVLSNSIDTCKVSYSAESREIGTRLFELRRHIPTFGTKRLSRLMAAFEPVPVNADPVDVMALVCDVLRCKPEKVGTIRNRFDKMTFQSPAQKKAGLMYRLHQNTISWCRRERSTNTTCRTFLAAYHSVCSEESQNKAFVVGGRTFRAEEIRKQYLYPISVDYLKQMPELYTMTDLMNWILNHPFDKGVNYS